MVAFGMKPSFDVDVPVRVHGHAMPEVVAVHDRIVQASSIPGRSLQLVRPAPVGTRAVDSLHCAWTIASNGLQLADAPIRASRRLD